ncbi:NAD(P)-dependent alcohol dehydrogenase [Qipengyuania qiaonensis]|uniref:NAD(P)-dependent alcohol dehydrogenase n=1 Tax=Qipengyuania qiaonensis TaxID=2867240 RepID=A0ABS7JAM7_9SPHN|nr:NAD(P)-dependent alcohol dehydrogenase [Qipengyuania qiaonensis]MBX7483000.1 NAD(P)-dependent alcohol dehydrogenase [Qipengyuania qiaonensis]
MTELFTAAVIRDKGGPFRIEQVRRRAIADDEVLVRVVATGMCHTDMVARDQIFPVPHPIVLGHEGSGIVDEVGKNVHELEKGDHVVLSFLNCNVCDPCHEGHPAYCANFNAWNFSGQRIDGSHVLEADDGTLLNDRFFGQSSFAQYAIANARNAIKVRKDAPLELLGPLGCGIQTGAGTVMNALKVAPGSSFAAWGGGAVGLSGVMAAAAIGATTIVAIDIVPSRLELAMELGATHTINSKEENAAERVKEITGGGAHSAMDSTGIAALVSAMVSSLRPSGTAAVVGASKPGTMAEIDLVDVMQSCKRLIGVVEGDSVPTTLIPVLVDLHMSGRFPFDRLVKFYDLDRINEAAEDSEKGITLKPIVRMPQ